MGQYYNKENIQIKYTRISYNKFLFLQYRYLGLVIHNLYSLDALKIIRAKFMVKRINFSQLSNLEKTFNLKVKNFDNIKSDLYMIFTNSLKLIHKVTSLFENRTDYFFSIDLECKRVFTRSYLKENESIYFEENRKEKEPFLANLISIKQSNFIKILYLLNNV
jgi:hypothetical protein